MKKNTMSIVAFGGILALASCASGPTPEEIAAQEQARQDSIAAVEQIRADCAQAVAEAEAAAYAAGQADAGAQYQRQMRTTNRNHNLY